MYKTLLCTVVHKEKPITQTHCLTMATSCKMHFPNNRHGIVKPCFADSTSMYGCENKIDKIGNECMYDVPDLSQENLYSNPISLSTTTAQKITHTHTQTHTHKHKHTQINTHTHTHTHTHTYTHIYTQLHPFHSYPTPKRLLTSSGLTSSINDCGVMNIMLVRPAP